MKKSIFALLTLCMLVFFSCEDEETILAPQIENIGLNSNKVSIKLSEKLIIKPIIISSVECTYQWFVNDKEISTKESLEFVKNTAGVYTLKLIVTNQTDQVEQLYEITVNKATKPIIEITSNKDYDFFEAGKSYNFSASISNKSDLEEVKIKWIYNSKEIENTNETITINVEDKKKNELELVVSNHDVEVRETIYLNKFKVDFSSENFSSENEYWWGKGGKYYSTGNYLDCYDSKIIDNILKISNLNFTDMMTKVGFATSNYSASYVNIDDYPSNQLDIQYAAYPATGIDKYMVFYKAPAAFGPTWNPDSLVLTKPVNLQSIKITNNAYTYCSMKKGDYKAEKFDDTDWYKTEITGWNNKGEKVGVVEAYLAKEGTIVEEWIDVDLSTLKNVSKLTFKMMSSDSETKASGAVWYDTPLYMCIADIVYELN